MGKMIHSMWELSLLSRSEHRDLAGLDTWRPEKDPELCAVRISMYLIWESLAPHLPLSRAQCNRNRMWQYYISKFILIAQQSGMIKYPESKFEFTALWRGEIWHDLTVYGEKSISPSTEFKECWSPTLSLIKAAVSTFWSLAGGKVLYWKDKCKWSVSDRLILTQVKILILRRI